MFFSDLLCIHFSKLIKGQNGFFFLYKFMSLFSGTCAHVDCGWKTGACRGFRILSDVIPALMRG